MSTPIMNEENRLPDWHNPFPEPQTMPSGWNFSGTIPDPSPATFEATDFAADD
jgi:hypothetical protein